MTFTHLNHVPYAPAMAPTLATRLLSTTDRPALSLQWTSPRAAADRASALGTPLTAASPGPLALARTTAALTTESPPGWITTRVLPTTGEYTFPGTISLPPAAPGAAYTRSIRATAVLPGARPVQVQTNSLFMRDVQVTGDLAGGGAVYIASMDEGGGSFPHMDTNYMFKSTDGGVTWANTYVGTPFPGPGVCSFGLFRRDVYPKRLLLAVRGLG